MPDSQEDNAVNFGPRYGRIIARKKKTGAKDEHRISKENVENRYGCFDSVCYIKEI